VEDCSKALELDSTNVKALYRRGLAKKVYYWGLLFSVLPKCRSLGQASGPNVILTWLHACTTIDKASRNQRTVASGLPFVGPHTHSHSHSRKGLRKASEPEPLLVPCKLTCFYALRCWPGHLMKRFLVEVAVYISFPVPEWNRSTNRARKCAYCAQIRAIISTFSRVLAPFRAQLCWNTGVFGWLTAVSPVF
jgi:hypothetical protein